MLLGQWLESSSWDCHPWLIGHKRPTSRLRRVDFLLKVKAVLYLAPGTYEEGLSEFLLEEDGTNNLKIQ